MPKSVRQLVTSGRTLCIVRKPILSLIALMLGSCRDPPGAPTIAPDPAKSVPAPPPTPPPAPAPSPSAPVTAYFPIQLDCKTDADCEGTSLGSDCCDGCGTIVGNKAWVARVHDDCSKPHPGSHTCPEINCPFQPYDARCLKGVCTRIPRK